MKHKTYMEICHSIANNESSCVSLHVGAVLVKHGKVRDQIVSTGYNGTPSGCKNCNEVNSNLVYNGEYRNYINDEARKAHKEWSKQNETHAEVNAILYATPEDRQGATLYCTHQPCENCSVVIASAGIKRVIYDQPYKYTPEVSRKVLENAGVQVFQLSEIDTNEKA